MMVQNEHWNGQPRPRSKLELRPSLRASAAAGRLGVGAPFEARQIVHVVVERLQRAVPGVLQHDVEPALLGLAAEDGDAHVHGRLDLGRDHRQHRQAARHMEAAQRHRQAGLDELAGEIDGARELVGLDADQADQRLAAAAPDVGHDAVRPDADIGLVERLDDDIDVGPQDLASPAILAQAVERGQGVRRDVRLQPRDRVAVIVVMRRLDQHQLEGRGLGRHVTRHVWAPSVRECRRFGFVLHDFATGLGPAGETPSVSKGTHCRASAGKLSAHAACLHAFIPDGPGPARRSAPADAARHRGRSAPGSRSSRPDACRAAPPSSRYRSGHTLR